MTTLYHCNASAICSKKNIDKETVIRFRKWCSDQKLPHLSEEQLLLFLSYTTNMEQAQNTILKYFQCKSKTPELFTKLDLDAEDIQEARTVYDIAVIPERTPDNRVVACGKLRNTSYSRFHLGQLIKLCCMALECFLYDGPVDGVIVVVDMKGIGLLHLTKLRLNALQKFFYFIQECVPFKIEEVHVLNTVNFIDKVIAILKPFLGKELYDVIKFYPNGLNSEDIFGSLPKSCLPKDYTGTLSTLSVLAEETYQKMSKLKMVYAQLDEQIKCYKEIKNT